MRWGYGVEDWWRGIRGSLVLEIFGEKRLYRRYFIEID
jgi:hypothetical protein